MGTNMASKATAARSGSRKFLVTGLSVASAAAFVCPAAQTKIFADAANQYQWTKQTDQDLKGGNYTSVASSADGSHLIIGSKEGGEGYNEASPLYVSSDYGATWQDVTDAADHRIRDYWTSVDITDDGQTMVAVSDQGVDLDTLNGTAGKIFISHNGGDTWTDVSPDGTTQWEAVAIAGDGSKIVAVANDDLDHIYVSTDGGANWQTSSVDQSARYWESASISDNGGKILVGGENDSNSSSLDYFSNDGGDNWTDISPDMGKLAFTTRATMSSSGDKLVVATYGYDSGEYDAVYESTNDGSSWADISPDDADINHWNAIAISGNGSELAVQDSNDKMYISDDNGASWTAEDPGQADDDTDSWRSIDFNNSGSRIVTVSDAYAYVGYDAALDVVTTNFANAEDGKGITLTTPGGTTITCHSPVKESSLSAQDGAYSYPLGLVDFCFSGADTSNEITLTFVTNLKPNQVAVRKYNPTTKQYATITGADITETTVGGQHALQVTYTIADNGPLDTDPTVGEVADPVGLAVLASAPTVSAPNTGLAHQSAGPSIAALLAGVTIAAGSFVSPIKRRIFSRSAPKQ